jgi:hypothetical protein
VAIKKSEIIKELALQLINLPQPIHLLAVASGGIGVGEGILKFFNKEKIESDYFEVKLNKLDGISRVGEIGFKVKNYSGTIVLVEDAINSGGGTFLIKEELKKLSDKKVYVAAMIDWQGRADFAVIK